MNSLVLLGSTGSIGTQTLDVARLHNMKIKALAVKTSAKLLEQQAREFHPEAVCIFDENMNKDMKVRLADTDIKVLSGMNGLCELAQMECDMVVNSVVGMVGLRPTIAAVEAGNTLALANKETLVVGGEIVTSLAKKNNVKVIPIDSEHSAIFQCLMGNEHNRIRKILLTASGGPFFGYTPEMLKNVTKEQALKHPNWSMGRKITIDSATLMNKGLELIEAIWLFDVAPEQVQIVVHRQSVIHSAVEYEDGSVIAQLGVPDMRTPIQFALTYPNRYPSPSKSLDLFEIGTFTFNRADEQTFKCLGAAKKAVSMGGNACCILNSANEACVDLFLRDKIKFWEIGEIVSQALESVNKTTDISLDIILETEKITRDFVHTMAKQ
ncbi:MAG: 1-deoxy-D-xylulose-5-phosphate reductoisomerase [Ruminiclostridium sp.]